MKTARLTLLGGALGTSVGALVFHNTAASILGMVFFVLYLLTGMVEFAEHDGMKGIVVKLPNPAYYINKIRGKKRATEQKVKDLVSQHHTHKDTSMLATMYLDGRIVEAVKCAAANACINPTPSICQAIERERQALMDAVKNSEGMYKVLNFKDFTVTHEEMHDVVLTLAAGYTAEATDVDINMAIAKDIGFIEVIAQAGHDLAFKATTVDNTLAQPYLDRAAQLVFAVEENEAIKRFDVENVPAASQLAMYVSTIVLDMNAGKIDWKAALPLLDETDCFYADELKDVL